MVQYYRNMWPRWLHILDPLKERVRGPKDIEMIWNNNTEVASRELKRMVSADNLLNYIDWKIIFTVQKYAYDKQLGAIISQIINIFLYFKEN